MPLTPADISADIARALSTPGDAYQRRLEDAAGRGYSAHGWQASQVLWRRQRRQLSLAPRKGAHLDASNPWESIEQADVADFLAMHPADLIWAHIPNERHGKRAAGVLAVQGVQPGVPDLCVWTPGKRVRCAGLMIELKRRKAPPSALSAEQARWLDRMRSIGWIAERANGAGPACALVELIYGRGWLP